METMPLNIDQPRRVPAGMQKQPCGDLVNAEVLGRHLGVSGRTVLRLAKQGSIPCVRLNRLVRFDVDAVDRALNRR